MVLVEEYDSCQIHWDIGINAFWGVCGQTSSPWFSTREQVRAWCDETECVTPVCECTVWSDAECVDESHRRQVRTCTPAGCDVEERIVEDQTCAAPPPPPPSHLIALLVLGVIVAGVVLLGRK